MWASPLAHCWRICPQCISHRDVVLSLGREDPLEEERATHSIILAWKTPRTEEPGGLQSLQLQRAGHDRVTEQVACPVRMPKNPG